MLSKDILSFYLFILSNAIISFIHLFIYFHSFNFIYLFIILGGCATITSKFEKLRRNSAIMRETFLDTNEM